MLVSQHVGEATLRYNFLSSVATAVFLCASMPAFAMSDVNFSLPAQIGTVSVPEFARQASIQIIAPGQKLREVRTNPVNGRYEVRAALDQLIRGTKLKVVSDDGSTIILAQAVAIPVRPVALAEPRRERPAPVDPVIIDHPIKETVGLEEITVTARKTRENLQSAPVAVTAFTAAAIEARGIRDVKDLGSSVPNLSVGTNSSGSSSAVSFGMRGLAQTDGLNTYDQAVGLYIDGVYMPRAIGNMLDLVDVERIEVIRGPQGVLYGKDTIGGAVNVVTRKPDSTFGGYGQVTFGSRDRKDVTLSVNIPLADGLAVRLTGATLNQDGYGRFILNPDVRASDHHVDLGQMQLRYTHGPLELVLAADGAHQRQKVAQASLVAIVNSPTNQLYNSVTGADIGPKYICADKDYCSYANYIPPDNLDLWGTSLTATYDFGAAQFKSITAYRYSHWLGGLDADETPFDSLELRDLTQKNKQFSEEVQLNGKAFDKKLTWLAGAYYSNETSDYEYNAFILHGLYPAIGVDADIHQLSDQKTRTMAIFGQASYKITNRLSATVGARGSWIRKEFEGELNSLNSGIVIFPLTDASKNWSFFNPKLSVEYQASRDAMIYASITRGNRSGGFNGRAQTLAAVLRPYAPEIVTQYEVGAKTEWFDRKLRINVAGFYSDYKDIQLTALAPSSSGGGTFDTVIANAGRAKIYGGELEAEAQLAKGLRANMSAGYTHNEFSDIDPLAIAAGVVEGSKLPRAPKWTYAVGLEYRSAVGTLGDIVARVDYSHTTGFQFSAKNSDLAAARPYGLLSARIAFTPAGTRLEISAFGKNLADKAYRVHGQGLEDSLGQVIAFQGPPREWGISAKYRF